ncbi:hypothetical protein AAMO2058_000733900 [Amorphochlora amoebiformis]
MVNTNLSPSRLRVDQMSVTNTQTVTALPGYAMQGYWNNHHHNKSTTDEVEEIFFRNRRKRKGSTSTSTSDSNPRKIASKRKSESSDVVMARPSFENISDIDQGSSEFERNIEIGAQKAHHYLRAHNLLISNPELTPPPSLSNISIPAPFSLPPRPESPPPEAELLGVGLEGGLEEGLGHDEKVWGEAWGNAIKEKGEYERRGLAGEEGFTKVEKEVYEVTKTIKAHNKRLIRLWKSNHNLQNGWEPVILQNSSDSGVPIDYVFPSKKKREEVLDWVGGGFNESERGKVARVLLKGKQRIRGFPGVRAGRYVRTAAIGSIAEPNLPDMSRKWLDNPWGVAIDDSPEESRENLSLELLSGSLERSKSPKKPSAVPTMQRLRALLSPGYVAVYVAESNAHRIRRILLPLDANLQNFRENQLRKFTNLSKCANFTGREMVGLGHMEDTDPGFHEVACLQGIVACGKGGIVSEVPCNDLRYPHGLAIDKLRGRLYIADTGNHVIRQVPLIVEPNARNKGSIVAGVMGKAGYADGEGSKAMFNNPFGLDIDNQGNIFVADDENHAIRSISPNGYVHTVIQGQAPRDKPPPLEGGSVSTDNLLPPDSSDERKIGVREEGVFCFPRYVAMDRPRDILYISSFYNHQIWRYPLAIPQPQSQYQSQSEVQNPHIENQVELVAGSSMPGKRDGSGSSALFHAPLGLATDQTGRVYIADCYNHVVRRISMSTSVAKDLTKTQTVGKWNTKDISRLFKVSVYSGSGQGGVRDGSATEATFAYPTDIAISSKYRTLILTDGRSGSIRIIRGGIHTSPEPLDTYLNSLFNYSTNSVDLREIGSFARKHFEGFGGGEDSGGPVVKRVRVEA